MVQKKIVKSAALAILLNVSLVSCLLLSRLPALHTSCSLPNLRMAVGYVPDGLTLDQWKQIQAKEQAKQKNLGRIGPKSFKSRSLQAWQEAGGKHLFPVDPKKVKTGEIPLKDVPYMQRKGSYDNSDLLGKVPDASKVIIKKTQRDIEYEQGGYLKEQAVSIFGGMNLPWTQQYQPMEWEIATGRKQVGPRSKVEGGLTKKQIEVMKKTIKEENENSLFGKLGGAFKKK